MLCKYVCIFMIYSCLGWIYESLFCTLKSGKWENRGFLYGPVCPIYGVGSVLIILIMELTQQSSLVLETWQYFLLSVCGSAVLEYCTAWSMEKLFHARWWDYSGLPLNLHGRISLFTSLGFGAAGLLIVYRIAPLTAAVMARTSVTLAEACARLATVLFSADLTLTVTSLLHFDRRVIRLEDAFNKNMEDLVDEAVQRVSGLHREIGERQKLLAARWSGMSGFFKPAVRRVHSFRYRDKIVERLVNDLILPAQRKK
jgi:uncharacterized membrane protein